MRVPWRAITAGALLGGAALFVYSLFGPPPGIAALPVSNKISPSVKDPVMQLLADLDAPSNARTSRYSRMATDTLQGLAWADPLAAIVLAERWLARSPSAANQLVVRAAATLDDPRPVRWWLDHHVHPPDRRQQLEKLHSRLNCAHGE
ncbi:MAG: hypothetical protein AAGH76_01270 [Pseudomonadota bacterium]